MGSQCLVNKQESQRPDTSCCNMESETNQCLFTSSCNQLGVCCQDPFQFEEYKPLTQLAQPGQCCKYAGDCMSGICIGQACREGEAINTYFSYKTILITLVAVAMSLAFCLSLCIMQYSSKYSKTIEMKIKNSDYNRNKDRLYPAVHL